MSVQNTLWTVAKILIFTALLALVLSVAGTCIVVFGTYTRIKSVGEVMQMELTRNNTLYEHSYYTMDSTTGKPVSTGFAAQLQQIANNSHNCFVFKGINVVNNDGTPVQVLRVLNTDTGEITCTKDDVGCYGDFRKIQLVFDIKTTVMFPQGVSYNQLIEHITTIEDVAFEFTAPCLRYLKGEGASV